MVARQVDDPAVRLYLSSALIVPITRGVSQLWIGRASISNDFFQEVFR